MAYPLYIIFKKSSCDSGLQASWKLGHITPIFKKGSKSEASNYRTVSLTSLVCKTLEHLVGGLRADIMKHMWKNKLLSDYQHGFVEGRSCTSQLFFLFVLYILNTTSYFGRLTAQGAIAPWVLSHHILNFLGSRWMETAPTSIEVFLRPTLVQSDELSDLRGSLSPTTSLHATCPCVYGT